MYVKLYAIYCNAMGEKFQDLLKYQVSFYAEGYIFLMFFNFNDILSSFSVALNKYLLLNLIPRK